MKELINMYQIAVSGGNNTYLLAIVLIVTNLAAVVVIVVAAVCHHLLIGWGVLRKPDQQAPLGTPGLLWRTFLGSVGGCLAALIPRAIIFRWPLRLGGIQVLETLLLFFVCLTFVGSIARWVAGLAGLGKLGEEVGTTIGFGVVLGTAVSIASLLEAVGAHAAIYW